MKQRVERRVHTCRADDSESDGASSDVNSRVCYRFINYESEVIGLSRVPGCLQKGHLGGGGDIKQMTQLKSLTRQKQLEVRRVWCYLRGAGGLCNDADGLGQLALGDFYSQTSWSLSQVCVQLSVWRWYPAAQLSVITPSPTIERRWVCNHEVHLKRKKEGVTH